MAAPLPNGMFEVYSFSDPGISYNFPILEACYAFPALSEQYSYCLSHTHSVYGLRTVECITDKDAVDGTHNGPDESIGEVDDGESDTDEDGDTNMGDRGGGDKPSTWHDYSESYDSQRSHSKNPVRDGDGYSTKRLRRIVTEPSTVDICGVFDADIESSRRYVEVVTEKEYDTTETYILLKRGRKGKLGSMSLLSIWQLYTVSNTTIQLAPTSVLNLESTAKHRTLHGRISEEVREVAHGTCL
ncbi:hypothetical protein K435DRAFT_842398 [Dendrothele bispora CBS 962.96]|uniref:Uncharacterized protein n=1 Tax=Dendrothele bispora (strain CBS 962.96) TaxID=1314807 RepID=A0A4S8LGZ0_DENBC|nr:hypothetical protein K435DRAFT_842398 [Dendrothele bispora CBS 962.96]